MSSAASAAASMHSNGCGATPSVSTSRTKTSGETFAVPARASVNERVPSWRILLRRSVRYASTAATVLITGETGVGKDALARHLHASGPRRGEPFVTVDCPAIPATLLEAELFGHERGAFTDATRPRAGRFELAGNGTVYLDSVTSLPLSGQGTLLRVLEERAVTRLGSTTPVRIGARIIASADASI